MFLKIHLYSPITLPPHTQIHAHTHTHTHPHTHSHTHTHTHTHLIFEVCDSPSLWSEAQFGGGQVPGVVPQAGDGQRPHQNPTHTGHAHQSEEHPAAAIPHSGCHGQRTPIIPLWTDREGGRALHHTPPQEEEEEEEGEGLLTLTLLLILLTLKYPYEKDC